MSAWSRLMASGSKNGNKKLPKNWRRNVWIGIIGGVLLSIVYSYTFEPGRESIGLTIASSLVVIAVSWVLATLAVGFRAKYYGTQRGNYMIVLILLAAAILFLVGIFLITS